MEPPPSLAWATATMPEATAAAAPPLDPPADRSGSHGLRVGSYAMGSVVIVVPNSGVAVRPSTTRPAPANASQGELVTDHRLSDLFNTPLPKSVRSPATSAPRSLSRKGTPANGPDAAVASDSV